MKRKILLLFSLLSVCHTISKAQICAPTQISYALECDDACGFPMVAVYSDNSQPPQHMDGTTLVVTWDRYGQGTVKYLVVDADGNTGEYDKPVTIGSTLTFSNAANTLCNSQSTSFTVDDYCGTLFNWSAPAGWSINGGSNTLTTSSKTVTITAPSTGSGNRIISVTSNTSGVVNQTVTLGSPKPDISTQDETMITGHTVFGFTATSYPGAAYHWYVNGVLKSNVTIDYFEWYIPCDQTLTFKCSFTNACGTSPFSDTRWVTGACATGGGGKKGTMSISPNPASSQLLISALNGSGPSQDNKTASQETMPSFSSSLYNTNGMLQKTGKSEHGMLLMDVKDVPAGDYILHVNNGGEISQHHIIISK